MTAKPDYVEARRDFEGVMKFSNAMLKKLDRKRREGRSGWWNAKKCRIVDLEGMLANHVKKGDMVDIANLAMMIWNRRNPR